MEILEQLEKLDTLSRITKIKELVDERSIDNFSILKEIKTKFPSEFSDALTNSVEEFIKDSKELIHAYNK